MRSLTFTALLFLVSGLTQHALAGINHKNTLKAGASGESVAAKAKTITGAKITAVDVKPATTVDVKPATTVDGKPLKKAKKTKRSKVALQLSLPGKKENNRDRDPASVKEPGKVSIDEKSSQKDAYAKGGGGPAPQGDVQMFKQAPTMTSAQALRVGPPVTFLNARGARIPASAILSGAVPAGTQVTMVTSTGERIPSTVVSRQQTAQIAGLSTNYEHQNVSLNQVRGGAGITNIIGIQPNQFRGLGRFGIDGASLAYYAGTQGMLNLMRRAGRKAAPKVYLLDVNGATASVVGGGGKEEGGGGASEAKDQGA